MAILNLAVDENRLPKQPRRTGAADQKAQSAFT
jgi:hypothetical protein